LPPTAIEPRPPGDNHPAKLGNYSLLERLRGVPLTPAYEQVNAVLAEQARTDPDYRGFATTLTMV